jgi:hypothetical protein
MKNRFKTEAWIMALFPILILLIGLGARSGLGKAATT